MVSTASEEKPIRAGSRVLHFLKRWRMVILLGLVCAGGGYEWYNKSTYDKTRQAIQQQLGSQPGMRREVKLAAIEPLIYGIPFRSTGRERGNAVINLAWRGLITTYPLQLQLDENGVLLGAYEIAPAAVHDAPDPRDVASKSGATSGLPGVKGLSAASSNVVCLAAPFNSPAGSPSGSIRSFSSGILLRELTRQALLIAARDELGMATRDPVLREEVRVESNATRWPLSIMIATASPQQQTRKPQLKVLEVNPRSLNELAAFDLKDSEVNSIELMTTRVEALSRREFPKLLEAKGYKRQILPSPSKVEIPQEAQEQLAKLNTLPQFVALRRLHAEIRKSGESPALLGGLAHSYATLGTLCEQHWSSGHKVFKARALLYAERLVAKYPGPAAYRVRAFARTLVGLHGAALVDLQAATQAAAGSHDPHPDRTTVLEAFCRGRNTRLDADFSDPAALKLARYLQYLAAELTWQAHLERPAARRVLELEPDCLRVIFPLHFYGNDSSTVQSSEETHEAMTQSVYRDLPIIPHLPESLRKLIQRPADATAERALQVQLLQNLHDAGSIDKDKHEPSLGVAEELIRDMHFTQAWKDAAFLHGTNYVYNNAENNAVTELRKGVAPLIAGHPYAGFLDSFQFRHDRVQEALNKLISSVQNGDVETTMHPISGRSRQYRANDTSHLERQMVLRSDPIFRDFITTIPFLEKLRDKTAVVRHARQMQEVCPQTPLCLAYVVNNDWDHVSQLAEQWEKEHPDAPPLLQAIGEKYYSQRRITDAERCFQQIIKVAKDQAAYHRLAELYYDIGDDEKSNQTREESLTVPGTYQDRINAHNGLAWNYRRVKNFPAACRHADALVAEEGGSWTVWPLVLAADCYEEAGDWGRSNEYHKQAAEVFEGTPQKPSQQFPSLDWYFWCHRTGRSDLTQAHAYAHRRIIHMANSNTPTDRGRTAVFYYCEDDSDKALEHFRWAFNADQDPYWGIQAALVADEIGNSEVRDSLLSDTLRAAVRQDHSLLDLIYDLRNALANPSQPLNLKVAEWRLRILSGGQPTNHWYYLGKFLSLRGNTEEGQRLLRLAAGSPATDLHATTMAGVSLVRDGFRPQPIRAVELDDEQPRISHLVHSAYDHLKKKEYEKAREFVERALVRSPAALAPLYVRARIAEESNQPAEAIADYSKCLEGVPESLDLLCRRGHCLELKLDYPAAIRDYERAIELDPLYGTPQLALAILRASCPEASQRDGAQALKLAQAASVAERLPTWRRDHALGLACAAAGDFDGAVKHGLQAVKQCPPDVRNLAQECLDLYRQGKVYIQKAAK